MTAAAFGTGQVFWSIVWFTLFFIWIWLLVAVFADVFRSRDLGGWGKALWTIFVIAAPFLGVFCYLIARGNKMNEHAVEQAQAQDRMMREYIRDAASEKPVVDVDQLEKLAALHDSGAIDDAEYAAMKAKVTAA
ncbi:MAG TPA: SHOCT domain-containing protein [Acidimicrobiales bacterium]|nr:SHOCT domain-containing protein [Acidimicrobiales bacterium]